MKIALKIIVPVFMGLSACSTLPEEPEYDNPIIPDDPTYEPPLTTIISGPAEGAVVDTHSVTFTWTGNQEEMDFTYRLDEGDWATWSADTSVTYIYQNEGGYLFEVKGRYPSGIEEDTAVIRHYTIDDIHGPALWLRSRYLDVAVDSTFTLQVILEEVENIFAVKAVLDFDPSIIEVDHVEVYEDSRSLLKSNGGTVIPFYSYNNESGTITVEVATATSNPPGVSGTGAMAGITLTAQQAGQTVIVFDGATEIRDPDNTTITLVDAGATMVEVQ